MREKLYAFYLKKSTFIFFAIVALLCWVSWCVTTVVLNNPIKLTIFGAIFAVLTFGMTLSYLKGEINVQKMLLGSILLFFIIDYIEIAEVYITNKIIAPAIIICVTVAVLVLFFISHSLQQQDHIGHSVIIVINQSCGFVILLSVAFLVANYILGIISFTDYTFCFSVMMTMFLIICMETRISVYKKIRAEHKAKGDWNEEARAEAKKLFKI